MADAATVLALDTDALPTPAAEPQDGAVVMWLDLNGDPHAVFARLDAYEDEWGPGLRWFNVDQEGSDWTVHAWAALCEEKRGFDGPLVIADLSEIRRAVRSRG